MEQATQATAPSTTDAERAAYAQATAVAAEIIGRVPVLPHSVRTGRELSPCYNVLIYFGAGRLAGNGVLQMAAVIDAAVTRDDQTASDGNVSSVWIEARGVFRGVPVYAHGLTSASDADALLSSADDVENLQAPAAREESAVEATQPLPTISTDPGAPVIPAVTPVVPLTRAHAPAEAGE